MPSIIPVRRNVLHRVPAVAGGGYTAQGVNFNGSTQYLHRNAGLTGAADGKAGTISFWFNLHGGDGSFQILWEDALSGSAGLQVSRDNLNKWIIGGLGAGAITRLSLKTNSSYIAGAGWHHLCANWDLAAATGNLFVDDVSDLAASPTLDNVNITYSSPTDQFFAARSGGSLFCNMDIADFWLNQTTSIDISNTTNRRKFVSASIHPVDLASDGSTPTGTAPIVYFSGAVASWPTNKGSGGGFTAIVAPTAAATNP